MENVGLLKTILTKLEKGKEGKAPRTYGGEVLVNKGRNRMEQYRKINKAWKEMARAVDHLKMDLAVSNGTFHKRLMDEEVNELIEDLEAITEKVKAARRILAVSDIL